MITLTVKEQPGVPLEAELLSPDVMATLSNDEIRALRVHLGKRQRGKHLADARHPGSPTQKTEGHVGSQAHRDVDVRDARPAQDGRGVG